MAFTILKNDGTYYLIKSTTTLTVNQNITVNDKGTNIPCTVVVAHEGTGKLYTVKKG